VLYDTQREMQAKVLTINKNMAEMSRRVDHMSVGTQCNEVKRVSMEVQTEEQEDEEEEPPEEVPAKGKKK
jgi:hypothetical protein